MALSLLEGWDVSVLLDSSGKLLSEKRSNPNRNSARGFEVIDEIKEAMEKACPKSCLVPCPCTCSQGFHSYGGGQGKPIPRVARGIGRVFHCSWAPHHQTGEPHWEVPLGRRDSTDATLSGSNQNIPAPNNTLPTIITKFKLKGLDIIDLVALSGDTLGSTLYSHKLVNFL